VVLRREYDRPSRFVGPAAGKSSDANSGALLESTPRSSKRSDCRRSAAAGTGEAAVADDIGNQDRGKFPSGSVRFLAFPPVKRADLKGQQWVDSLAMPSTNVSFLRKRSQTVRKHGLG
jgi:hypothetical protein